MVSNYWKQNRTKIFPKIKDWTQDPKDLIKGKKVKQLTYEEWLYLHPSAYNLIMYGTTIIAAVISFLFTLYANKYGSKYITLFFFIMFCIFTVLNLMRWNKRNITKGMTIYDMFMRDSQIEKNLEDAKLINYKTWKKN